MVLYNPRNVIGYGDMAWLLLQGSHTQLLQGNFGPVMVCTSAYGKCVHGMMWGFDNRRSCGSRQASARSAATMWTRCCISRCRPARPNHLSQLTQPLKPRPLSKASSCRRLPNHSCSLSRSMRTLSVKEQSAWVAATINYCVRDELCGCVGLWFVEPLVLPH